MRKLSTAVPIRDMEREATPSGPVVTYQMSEEELRNMRKKLVHKSGLDRIGCLRQLAMGNKPRQIAKTYEMADNEIYVWLKKWELAGLSHEQLKILYEEELLNRSALRVMDKTAEAIKEKMEKQVDEIIQSAPTEQVNTTHGLPTVEIPIKIHKTISQLRELGYNNCQIVHYTASHKWDLELAPDVFNLVEPIYQVSDLITLVNALQFGYEVIYLPEDKLHQLYQSNEWDRPSMGMREAYRLGIKTACETLGHDFGWL